RCSRPSRRGFPWCPRDRGISPRWSVTARRASWCLRETPRRWPAPSPSSWAIPSAPWRWRGELGRKRRSIPGSGSGRDGRRCSRAASSAPAPGRRFRSRVWTLNHDRERTMCGIVGILSLDPRRPVDPERVQRMRDVLAYRGPDGAGLWADGPVALGHRRLAIVDLAGGHQPMANEAGSVCITYNGEIYNHLALRASLEQRGHRYRTWSDTETILHLYEEEGEKCVERLRGMFAFALWDRARSRLLLARDRLGIKPLY